MSLGDVDWPVSTARLSLRQARADDADAVLSYRRSPRVAEWLGAPPGDFHDRFVAPERLDLLLIIGRGGAIIGDLTIKIGDVWAPAELARGPVGCKPSSAGRCDRRRPVRRRCLPPSATASLRFSTPCTGSE